MLRDWSARTEEPALQTELRSLLADMKEGVGDLTTKVTDSVAVYQGNEDDKVIEFGQYEANIDGPR